MNFEYYYGTQADQFSFIRIPRILLLDEAFSALSLSAKVLYSVLLDRMGLSMKNKWLDEENKVYIIYQITEIQSDLGFSKKKAMDYLTELEKIGLIEKKKRGFGLPNIIYVKSFMAHQSSQRSNEMGTSQEKDAVHRSIEIGTSEVMNKHLRGAETDTSEVPKNGLQEVPKTVPLYNKTYMNYNNQSNMKSNHIKSDGDRIRCDQKEQTINAYAELVKKNIDFDVLLHTYSREQDLVEEIYQLILETVQTEKNMIRIAGEYYPAGFVKGKLLKLNYSHIEYVLECMDKNTTKVRNIKQYLLAALFNAPSTIGSYYKARHATVRKLKEVLMIVLRMAGKILLLPMWLLLATAHLLVKIVVEIYCIGKGIVNLILGFMLIGTLLWYRQWERFALLAVASGILLFFLWIGVFMEVILESAQHKIGKWIIQI